MVFVGERGRRVDTGTAGKRKRGGAGVEIADFRLGKCRPLPWK